MTAASQPSLVLVGRYRLDAPQGQNDDGWFCRAHDLVLGRTVMVKMFKAVVDEPAARAFAARAKSLVGVRNDHLVALYDGGVADGHPYLVLEPIDGVDSPERPMSASETAALGAALADALAGMHANGIVHGDVTLTSVLIDADGRPRLVGLGFGHTRDRTARADVHALGLLLRQCLNGPDADRLDGTTPWPLARVLTAMTSRNPARRPSAAVCARQLGRAAETLEAGRWSPTAIAVQRGRVAGFTAVGGLVTGALIAFAPASVTQHVAEPVVAPLPTTAAQLPTPDPTTTATSPGRPSPPPPTTHRSPTPTARPTTSAHPTTDTQAPTTTSVEPTSADPTTADEPPPDVSKKPGKQPPGLLKKWFWLAEDTLGWPFDW